MASFVVMEPPLDRPDDEAVLVRDGFHFFAFLIPFLWFLAHRLWIEALAALLVAMAIGWLGSLAMVGGWAAIFSLLFSIFVGMEAAALKVGALRRRGWREWGVVEAVNADEAELRYAAEKVATEDEPPPIPAWSRSAAPAARRVDAGPALGLLGMPGAR